MSDSGKIDDSLLDAVQSKKVVDKVIVKGADRADTKTQGFTCEVEILADMAGVEIDIPVCPLAVFPP